MTLAFRPEYRSSQKETNDPVVKILFESICEDGQSMPLDEIEIEFLLHQASLTPSSGILNCLIHQASFHESPVRASELFKVCLDHAILELNDEALASRIIASWLTRLQPHRNEFIKISEGAQTSPNTIDQLGGSSAHWILSPQLLVPAGTGNLTPRGTCFFEDFLRLQDLKVILLFGFITPWIKWISGLELNSPTKIRSLVYSWIGTVPRQSHP